VFSQKFYTDIKHIRMRLGEH